jgi:hypothetical protein
MRPRPAQHDDGSMPPASSRIIHPFLPIWRRALSDTSGATFAEVVAPRVRLEGSIYAAPVDGRDQVWTCLRTAAGFTDTLTFIRESTAQDRSYLEWEQEGLAQRIAGITVLTFDESGLIVNVALHHRPLGAVLAYSAEMGRRLGNSVGPDVFYQTPRVG